MKENIEKYTNDLIHESSPYLLQHAHNPVNWIAWSDDLFENAKSEDKLILVSVGYSACHWCHVMEHESFEDEEVAAIMNKFFICVKVDREERPDIDQVYMTAVQLMTQQGGWPLNCITLPDGRAIYGGTYFQKEQWMQVLKSLEATYRQDKDKVIEYAEKLHEGIVTSSIVRDNFLSENESTQSLNADLQELVQRWAKNFDSVEGGPSRAPKFMLPNNYSFLLKYGKENNNDKVLNHVKLTLDKMARGGIYDQIGGGFSRYSVDMLWKVPHFEKMLYDNAQLIQLYSEAYEFFPNREFKFLVYQTISWLQKEMLRKDGLFYSAYDADSEGVEGKFYVWKLAEIKTILQEDFEFATEYFDFSQKAQWEGNIILLRKNNDGFLKQKFGLTDDELTLKIAKVCELLYNERKTRIWPGLDNKCLTSWNAMTVCGLVHAAQVFEEEEFKLLARKNLRAILAKAKKDGNLFRNLTGEEPKIHAFLEDYAHLIQACIAYYSIDFEIEYLLEAKNLMESCIDKFSGDESLFYFTEKSTKMIVRQMEVHDNVIPASNSVMANNLYVLGQYFELEDWRNRAKNMLQSVKVGMVQYGSSYSNWAMLALNFTQTTHKAVIVGENHLELARSLAQNKNYKGLIVSGNEANALISKDKIAANKTLIYLCDDKSCKAPVESLEEINIHLDN